MKIAVTASQSQLSGNVDPRFGRAAFFLIVNPDTMEFEAAENPHAASPHGAGIQAAQFVSNQGVKALLTGSCGPNAFQTLQAAGVEVFVGVSGTVKSAVEQYQTGKLQKSAQSNVQSHFGMGTGGSPGGSPVTAGGAESEIVDLKKQNDSLRQNLAGLIKRIEELEKKK